MPAESADGVRPDEHPHPVPGDDLPVGLLAAVRELIHVFAHADTLGSLIDPDRICRDHGTTWDAVQPYWQGLLALGILKPARTSAPNPLTGDPL